MSKAGRKAYADAPRKWTMNLPSSVALPVEERLKDPLTGRVMHGARSKLVARLLRAWLREQEQHDAQLPEITLDDLDAEC